MTDQNATQGLRDGWIPDKELADIRGVSQRTQRAERQRGDGPPYVKDGRSVLYWGPGYRDYLAGNMRPPVRSRSARTA
jgi:hypothetical protein